MPLPASLKAHVLSSPEALSAARGAMHVESGRLGQVRSEALQQNEQRVDGRVLDLVLRELAQSFSVDGDRAAMTPARTELSPRPSPSVEQGVTALSGRLSGGQTGSTPEPLPVHPTARADAARRLVERIETFVRSQRPGLTLAVAGAINAQVDVERTGPNEVALKIRATRGVPHAEDIARIRQEIQSRGLHLASLSLG